MVHIFSSKFVFSKYPELNTADLIISTAASIATFLCAALGCMSRATKIFAVSSVNVDTVVNYLSEASGLNITELSHPELPTSWSFGLSGKSIINP